MATKQTGRKLADLADSAGKAGKVVVRIKPLAPKKGYVMRKFTAYGILFEEDKGWYSVDPHVGKYLSDVRVRPDQPDHPHFSLKAFDVCTPAEAKRLAEQENEAAISQGRAAPHKAHQVVARDVTTGTPMGPKPSEAPPRDYDPKVKPTPRAAKAAPEDRRMRAGAG